MRISRFSPSHFGSVGVLAGGLLLSPAMSPCAYAFGGFWSSRTAPVKQAAEGIVFVDNPDATVTAIIQVTYAGPAQKFAWVIPVPGKPKVGVSSNTVFRRLDAATAPEYWVEVTLEGTCKTEDDPKAAAGADSGAGGARNAADAATAPIATMDQGSVGPYDYVDIRVDPTLGDPAKVATDWLATNGYDLTDLESKVLTPYLKDGLNLLAVKLTKGTDAGAIRPLVLTYESKLPAIPIRPTSVAARDGMGIQVWVFGPSQAIPDNYKSLVLNEARIDWLSGGRYVAGTLPVGGVGPFGTYVSKPRNYDAVVTAAANEAGGQGFVTELGGPASQYRNKVWSPLDEQEFSTISSQSYADGIDAILAANRRFGGWDGWKDAIQGATTMPAGVTVDEFGRNPEKYRGVAKVDGPKFFQLLRENVVRPVADAAAMFYRAPYLTRLYSTMSPDEMTVDPVFTYNADLAQVSNVHIARQFVQCTATVNPHDAPWRIKLPQGGVIAGKGSGGWPVAEGAMPANLKIVALSTRGSGTVVKDNSEDIGRTLFKAAGTSGSGMAVLRPPQNGVMIGAVQETVTPQDAAVPTPQDAAVSTPNSPKSSGESKCSVSRAGGGMGSALAPWSSLSGVILALGRRRRRQHHQAERRPVLP